MKWCLGLVAALAMGCSHAGPFVSNVSPDGRGGLNIERCQVNFNMWTSTISTGNCSTSRVQVVSSEAE